MCDTPYGATSILKSKENCLSLKPEGMLEAAEWVVGRVVGEGNST